MLKTRVSGGHSQSRLFGWALIAAGVLAVVFMLHHPVAEGGNLAERLASMESMRGVASWVHGLLCAVLVVIWAGLMGLSQNLGWHRFAPVCGFVCISAGSLLYIGAAMISGFVVPELAADGSAGAAKSTHQILALLWHGNQALANAGAVATAAAIGFLSCSMLSRSGLLQWTGGVGVVIAGATLLGLVLGWIALDVRGMTLVTIAHSGWYVLAGLCLLGPMRAQNQQ